jgi:hypothetical protein
MLFDIVLKFFTGYISDTLVMEMKKVWLRYLFSYFPCEFIAVIPGLLTGGTVH